MNELITVLSLGLFLVLLLRWFNSCLDNYFAEEVDKEEDLQGEWFDEYRRKSKN